jgi:bis(5'-nucleosidyl)-tetraphosphatase
MTAIDQAGAIVIRPDTSAPLVLLVSSRRNPAHWVFPKGHVERGETFEMAAVREAEEEAGVNGTLFGSAGSASYQFGTRLYVVQYFLMLTRDQGTPELGRRLVWCAYDDALERITFDNTRALLRASWPRVIEHVATL